MFQLNDLPLVKFPTELKNLIQDATSKANQSETIHQKENENESHTDDEEMETVTENESSNKRARENGSPTLPKTKK